MARLTLCPGAKTQNGPILTPTGNSAFYSCLSKVCDNLPRLAILGNYFCHFLKITICDPFLKIYIFSRNSQACGQDPQTVNKQNRQGSQNVLGNINILFVLFFSFVDSNRNTEYCQLYTFRLLFDQGPEERGLPKICIWLYCTNYSTQCTWKFSKVLMGRSSFQLCYISNSAYLLWHCNTLYGRHNCFRQEQQQQQQQRLCSVVTSGGVHTKNCVQVLCTSRCGFLHASCKTCSEDCIPRHVKATALTEHASDHTIGTRTSPLVSSVDYSVSTDDEDHPWTNIRLKKKRKSPAS